MLDAGLAVEIPILIVVVTAVFYAVFGALRAQRGRDGDDTEPRRTPRRRTPWPRPPGQLRARTGDPGL